MTRTAKVLNKSHIRQSFARAALSYDAHAVLQYEIADRLLERLDLVRMDIKTVLDVGSGTGYCTRELVRRYPDAHILGVDLSPEMARQAFEHKDRDAKCHYLCGDAEVMPIAGHCVDLIVSNLTLQWCDAQTVFDQFVRVLRPGGAVFFTSFGPDTLKELRQAWQAVDDAPHVHSFMDIQDLGDALLHSGLAEPVMDTDHLVLHYADVDGIMRDLKGIGAHNIASERPRGLTGKNHFNRFRKAYKDLAMEGKIPASYEVIFGHAWAPIEQGSSLSTDDPVVPVTFVDRHR